MSSPAMKNLKTLSIICLLVNLASAQTAKQSQAKSPQDNSRSAIGGVLVSPLMQRVSCQPGRKAEIVFVTENPGQLRETAQAEILPFTTEDWSYRTKYGVEHPHDCSTWFASRSNDVTIEPGARQELHLPLTVPRGTAGSYWCMLKFTPRPSGSQTKSLVVYEIPIVVIVGKNPKPVVKVGTPFLRKVDPKSPSTSMMAVLPLDNSSEGFSVLGATGTLRSRTSNRVVADFQVEDRNLMPQTKRELAFIVPKVADGTYVLSFKPVLGVRSLPEITSEVTVAKGQPKLSSEKQTLETTPVTVEPASLNLAIPPGGHRSAVVKITNNSTRELSFEVKPSSVEQGSNGAVGIGDGGLPFGLSVDVSGDTSHIQPGQSALARLQINVPREAKGDLWFALSVREAGNGSSLADAIFGTISVPKTEAPNMTIEEPVEVRDGSKLIAIKFKVRNGGNVALRPDASASVLADGVRLVDRLAVPEVGDGGVLPGKTIMNSVMLPANLKPGAYVVEVAYQFGEKDFARTRISFNVAAKAAVGKK